MRLSPGISTPRSRGMIVVLCGGAWCWLALALFVTGIFADDANHIVAADDLAGFAEAFDGGSDFHTEKI